MNSDKNRNIRIIKRRDISIVLFRIVKDIKFELGELEALFDLYREELFELNREPILVELTAFAVCFI
jgi:hypothetical protein